jgi:hypothetical protein
MQSWLGGVARGMLAYALAVALLATLAPFDFRLAEWRRLAVMLLADDVLRNLLLLFPAGFLYALAERGRPARALGLGLAFGLAVELAQLFLPTRHPNLIDVLANGLGAWGGALAEQRLRGRLARLLTDELVLELPLTGALYLLAPLLMVHALASHAALHAWLIVLLALFAAPIAAALYRERVAHTAALSRARFVLYATSVFVIAALPALLRRPWPVLAATVVLGLALLPGLRDSRAASAQRRFEARTAGRALPWFVLYLAGLTLVPRPSGQAVAGNLSALRLVEACAALTVLGYLLSELSARRHGSGTLRAAVVFALGAAVGVLFELSRSTHELGVLLRPAALGLAALAGAHLHAAQVRLVQSLRQRRASASSAASISPSPTQ